MNRRTFVLSSAASILSFHPLMQAATASPQGQWLAPAAALPINIQEIYPTVHQGRFYVAGGIASKLGVPYFSKACYSFDPRCESMA